MKRLGRVLTIIFLAASLVVGGTAITAIAAEETIKIGALLDFTGPIAFIGPIFKTGIEYAFEEVNWTVGGKKIELIAEDTASDPTTAMEKAKKLVEMDKVKIILGPLMGDQQLSVGPYLKGKKVLITTFYCGMFPVVEFGNWLVYPTTVEGLTMPLGWYCADLGYKKMVMIGADYAGGHGFMAGIKMAFEEKGGEVIQEIWTPVGTTDYGPFLTNISKDADCVTYKIAGPTEVMRFLPQYKQFGIKTPLYGTTLDSDLPADIMKDLGDAVLGLEGQSMYIDTRQDPFNEKFREDLKKKTGHYPGGLENNSYCVAEAVLTGLIATGGDDSFDKLRPAVLSSQIDTPQGPLAWGPEGVAIVNVYIAKAKHENEIWFWDPIKVFEKVVDIRLKK